MPGRPGLTTASSSEWPVLMLEALAEQGGAAGCAADEEPSCSGVCGCPNRVTDSLEAEHRVEGEERHHRHATVWHSWSPAAIQLAIEPASVMPFLENLAVRVLNVRQQHVVVDGLVQLAELGGVDLQLLEQGSPCQRCWPRRG